MATQNQFIEGLDPTPFNMVEATQLLQLIREAKPAAYIGFIYFGSTQPDIANNPQYARYIWADTTIPAAIVLKTYTGSAWVAYSPVAGSLSGTVITDATLALTKLSLAGATANYLLVVNGAGTAYTFKSPATLFNTNSFPTENLVSGANRTFLTSIGGLGAVWRTLTITDVLADFPNSKMQTYFLDPEGASDGQVLTYDAALARYTNKTPVTPTIINNPTIPNQIVFTSSGPWTVPANKTLARFKLWGGGGGGDIYGGGGGGYTEKIISVSPGDIYDIVIGNGGDGKNGGTPAGDGLSTTLSNSTPTVVLQALGGKSGKSVVGFKGAGAALAYAVDPAVVVIAGGAGGYTTTDSGVFIAAAGGSSPMGGSGGAGGDGDVANRAGVVPGGGGSGVSNVHALGGAGAKGMLVIEY